MDSVDLFANSVLFNKTPRGAPKRAFAEALYQSGWLDVLARFTLLFFRSGSTITSWPTGEFALDCSAFFSNLTIKPVSNTIATFNDMFKMVKGLASIGPVSREAFANAYPDWIKVMNQIRMLIGARGSSDSTLPYVYQVLPIWSSLGQAVGFGDWDFFKSNCTYPRCVGGLSTCICARCGRTRYCGLSCQRA
jgi:hypothetical protein